MAATAARRRSKRNWAPYGFLSPAAVFFFVFFLGPVLFSLYISFFRWNPFGRPRFRGLENYVYVLTKDPNFFPYLKNTFVFALGTVVLTTVLGLLVALIFAQSRGKALWRTIYWLPMGMNVVAIGWIWMMVLRPTWGVLNRLLAVFGLPGPLWLEDAAFAMPAVILVSVWAGLGGTMLLFTAGLEGIDRVHYEAARVDGATPWQEFWSVTLPLLRPTLLFVLVTGFIAGLSNFALILVMTRGGPAGATNVVANYMWETAFQSLRMGRASAMAYILFAIILVITLIQLRIFRRGGVESY